ncbi:MAG: YtxH domain-containing protein [Chloroflexi bacterium]|nr:YtxH domain-containing protein [Chloroflexota bacterium]MBU1752084.1 YtxH domain-containing protein [Chloroflexota bacterium]
MRIDWRYFVLGLLTGGVVGMMWGLLNAPYSGVETQELMALKVRESLAEGQEAMAARERELRGALTQGRGR